MFDDDDLWRSLSPRQSAQRTAVVAQETTAEFDFSVNEVVAMGRSPHKRALEREDNHDRQIVADALDRVRMTAMAGRIFATLSGGEKQRVLVARALAQESRLLVLDEPTNHLDIKAQLELLALVRELGTTTIAALHDLNLAAAYCDRLYVLQHGRVAAHGAIADVLTPRLIQDVSASRHTAIATPSPANFTSRSGRSTPARRTGPRTRRASRARTRQQWA